MQCSAVTHVCGKYLGLALCSSTVQLFGHSRDIEFPPDPVDVRSAIAFLFTLRQKRYISAVKEEMTTISAQEQ